MRKIIIMMILLNSMAVYSQEYYPPQAKFWIYPDTNSISKDSVLISPNLNRFRLDNQFILGWHWGNTRKVSESMGFNYVNARMEHALDELPSKSNLYFFAPNVSSNTVDEVILQAMGIEYSAVNKNSDSSYSKYINGINKYAFGFKTINGEINSDGWLYLNSQYSNQIVLKENTPNKCLNTTKDRKDQLLKYFGQKFYLGITLKRTDNNNLLDTTPVLKIKLPYWINNSRGVIKFSKSASNRLEDSISVINNAVYRGSFIPDLLKINNDTSIVIRRNMIPLNNGSIQLLFSFICDDKDSNNRILPYNNSKLDIEVEYLGNLDIAIKNVTIETPAARELFWGYHDQSIIESVQTSFDLHETPEARNRKIFIKRFYTRDEGNEAFHKTYRYFNDLIGNIGIAETDYDIYREGMDYTKNNEYWLGVYKSYGWRSRPFMLHGPTIDPNKRRVDYRIGIDRGYDYCSDTLKTAQDTLNFVLNSGYEIYKNGIGGWNFQNTIQECVNDLADNLKGAHLFSDKFWFSQCFFDIWHNRDPNFKLPNGNFIVRHTPWGQNRLSGEEMRLYFWQPLILGAKGLLADGEWSNPCDNDGSTMIKCTIGNRGFNWLKNTFGINITDSNLTDIDFLRNDLIGSDFLFPDSLKHYEFTKLHDYLDINLSKYYQGISDISRLYLGRKSTRMEMFKVSKLIRSNEEEILGLKLQAWYSKGLIKKYKQHPKYPSNKYILSDFVHIQDKKLATRPIARQRYDQNNNNWVDFWENEVSIVNHDVIDSSLFDITLLSTKNDTLMQNEFVLGVLNRRTDPLIYFTEDTSNRHILFLSTAELEDFLEKDSARHPISGVFYPKSIWEKYYWKRLGCREISIPISIDNASHNFEGRYYQVKELGADSPELNDSICWWRKQNLYHKIDTIVSEDDILRIRLLPGEGKLLKFTKLNNLVNCDLCDSTKPQPFTINYDHEENCCADMILNYNGDCELNHFLISIKSINDTILQEVDTSVSEEYYHKNIGTYYLHTWKFPQVKKGIPIKLGRVCFNHEQFYTFNLIFNSKNGTKECKQNIVFNSTCLDTISDAKICCDSIKMKFVCERVDTNNDCNYRIMLNGLDSTCNIYGLAVKRYYCGQNKVFIDSLSIPFSNNQKIVDGSFSPSVFNPFGKQILMSYEQMTCICYEFNFLSVNGDTICRKEICRDDYKNLFGQQDDPDIVKCNMDKLDFKNSEGNEINGLDIKCIPNPITSKAEIKYTLNKKGNVTIELINLLGERYEILNNTDTQGIKTMEFDTKDFNSGMYYLRISNEGLTKTININILK